jgi:hypothetical protein
MKRFITVFLCLVIAAGACVSAGAAYGIEYNGTTYTYSDISNLASMTYTQGQKMEAAHAMAEAARKLGYDESHSTIVLAKQEYNDAKTLKKGYQATYDSLVADYNSRWSLKESQYPSATYVWRYLTETLGYNNYVAAGIMGNMMGECGGGTLNLKYWVTSSSGNYYGLCQWSRGYSGVWGASLEGQCAFLANTISYELNTYGRAYASGFNYSKFLNLSNEQQAAKAFFKCYERGAASTCSARMKYATIAYNYFTA